MIPCWRGLFFLWLSCVTLPSLALAQAQTHRPVPSSSSTVAQWQNYLVGEFADRWLDQGLTPFVSSGGIHATTGGLTSAAFATTAIGAAGGYISQASAAITYDSSVGCASTDLAWVVVTEGAAVSVGGNFVRVPGTHYAVDCVATTRPTLPTGSAWLMAVTITSSVLTRVEDLRQQWWFGVDDTPANGHGTTTLLSELRRLQGDSQAPSVLTGCLPVPSGTTTLAAFACEVSVRASDAGLVYVTQSAATVGPLSGGDGTYWLLVHRDTTTAVGGWTRQAGTHYLWQKAGSQPATVSDALLAIQMTVSGGAVTALTSYGDRLFRTTISVTGTISVAASARWRFLTGGSVTVSGGVTLVLGNTPEVDGPPRQIFAGAGIVRVGSQRPSSPHWWGAQGDGTTDDTAAFNLATQSTASLAVPLRRVITLEPGLTYYLAGTVYIRAGQTLTSAGGGTARLLGNIGGTDHMIRLGDYDNSGTPTYDSSSGIAPSMQDIHIDTGPGTKACVFSRFAGYFIRHMQITNCGIGLYLQGADGLISDILVDQGLNGIIIDNAQNLLFSNILIFLANYQITIGSNVYDIQFSNLHLEYPQYAGIYFLDSATNILNVQVTNVEGLMNVQYPTFAGFVYNRSSGAQAMFRDCSFRNMFGYAVANGAGSASLSFQHCTFEGLKSNPGYAQSTTAAGIAMNGLTLMLSGVEFLNLLGSSIDLSGASTSTVRWDGGRIVNSTAAIPFAISNSNTASRVDLGNITGSERQLYSAQAVVPVRHFADLQYWFPPAVDSGARWYWLLPYQRSTAYEITVTANMNSGGSAAYAKVGTYGVDKDNDFTGITATSYLDLTALHRSAAQGNGLLDVAIAFTAVGGGLNVTPHTDSGFIAVSVPNTYSHVQLSAKQLITTTPGFP